MNRFFASFAIAILAGLIAHDCGVPWWRNWEPGDVSDIAITSFYAAFWFIGAMRVKVIVNNNRTGDAA